jgi:hypothetical protein
MSRRNFERQLASLELLRQSGPAAAESGLRKALSNRNNYIAAKAAKIAAELGLATLVPDLLAALDRFFTDPVHSDPKCWAKDAIVTALASLGHTDPAPFLRGFRHVQMEPVWGGREDTAGTLRGHCAGALVACGSLSTLELLRHLTEVLADPEKAVRVEAAKAIGRVNTPEGALLLRLRALAGDPHSEIVGACFSALLSIEGEEGIAFVSRFLDAGGETAEEAALALGLMRDAGAFRVLRDRYERESKSALAAVLLSAIAFTRLPEATEYLTGLVEADSAGAEAIQALAGAGLPQEVRARTAAAVNASGSAALRAAYEKYFR